MKKILTIAITALLVSVLGCAEKSTDITVINPSHKTSPAAVFATSYRDALDASYYQSADCEDGGRKYNNTENAVFIYNSSMEFAGRNKGLDCNLAPLENKTVVFVGQHHFKLCKLPGTEYDLVPGNKQRINVGQASMLVTNAHQQTWRDAGVNVKLVPYSGSKTVLKALLAGDINIGYMGQGIAAKAGNKIECLYSTNPTATNFLGNAVPQPVPNFHISFVVYTNSTDPVVLARLKDVKHSKHFATYLNKSQTSANFDITPASTTAAVDYVQNMYVNWAD